ncbi:MAG: exodeoxyribonuclease VII large subunit [Actinomycetales bacterium]|nr:exodeoxyribonuclease VII large subunit [Actinomycetales bacterium]
MPAAPATTPRGATPEDPLPLRDAADRIAALLRDLPARWLEGQVTEVKPRPGATMAFLTLRDVTEDVSFSLVCHPRLVTAEDSPAAVGQRVVVLARPEFWRRRGQLMLRATEIRAVGLGDLLARLERLRRALAAEGLFDDERKQPLPFLPHAVGLITGRAGDARHDVIAHTRRRWPAVRLVIREVAVQGATAAAEVTAALQALATTPGVDVIVIARGGGSFEDLLPFSDETLLRAVADCRIPVVSAIGHEADTPLLDLVADRRASTPTDAARLIVPDAAAEAAALDRTMVGVRARVAALVAAEHRWLADVRSRPVLADPTALVGRERGRIAELRTRITLRARAMVDQETTAMAGLVGRLRALSPQATLDRGYAVVIRPADGAGSPPAAGPPRIIRDAAEVGIGEPLLIRVARGRLGVVVNEVLP